MLYCDFYSQQVLFYESSSTKVFIARNIMSSKVNQSYFNLKNLFFILKFY